jgi:hypothetical protein
MSRILHTARKTGRQLFRRTFGLTAAWVVADVLGLRHVLSE